MKTRVPTIIIFILFILFNVGYGAFILNDGENFYDYELSNNTDYYVTIDYNDGHTPDYIYHLDSAEGIVDTSVLESPSNEKNHTFVGWYTTKDGFNTDGTSSKYNGEKLAHNSTLYAKYVNNDTALMTNKMVSTLNVLPSYAGSSSNRYYISSYSSEVNYALSIKSGAKLSLHYAESSGEYSSSTNSTNSYYKFVSNSRINGVLDSNLIIDGGTFQVNSVLGGSSGSLQALITDPNYSSLDLNGYNIIIRNGGTLNGYGIIYNSKSTGGIICENGSIYTPYLVYGFKGGGLTGSSFANAVSPFDNYLCPYLSCETIFTTSGKLYGETSLYANNEEHVTTIPLIGNNSSFLVQLNSGFIIRKQTPYQDIFLDTSLLNPDLNSEFSFYEYLDSTYRENFIFTNECQSKVTSIVYDGIEGYSTDRCHINLNSLSLNVSIKVISTVNLNVSMKYVDYPIPSFFDLAFYNTDLDFAFSIMFMPGSTCFVDDNSVLNFKCDTSGSYPLFAKLTTLEKYGFSTACKNPNSNNAIYQYPEKSTPPIYCAERLFMSVKPAEITINGNIIFDTSVTISFANYYQFYSLGGRINLSKKALSSVQINKAYLKLCSDITQNIFYAYGSSTSAKYCVDFAQFNTLPLISYNKAYIQIAEGGDVLECNKYDLDNSIYYYQDEPYFYRFTSSTTTYTVCGIFDFSSYTSSPGVNNTKAKYKNNYGIYTKCSFYRLDEHNPKLAYITYNGTYYLLINNGYVAVSNAPSIDSNTNMVMDNVPLASANILSSTSSGITFNQNAWFDYKYLKEWRCTHE